MLNLWESKCALTGCSIASVLIASHAKAWADSSNHERLDEYNGLLLSATFDKLFDAGLISFSDEGDLLLSSALDEEEAGRLGIGLQSKLRFVHVRHLPYMRSHRERYGF